MSDNDSEMEFEGFHGYSEYIEDGTVMLTGNGYKTEEESGMVKRRRKSHNSNNSNSSNKRSEPKPSKQFAMNRLSTKKGNKQWVHPPEALLRGHIVYNVKFLGHVEVDQPKGTEVVKDAIRKMKFNKQLKKAEGQKPPKVELTISVDGVTVQEPKHKIMQHQYPLHRISYCADDKTDKKMFTFIAKETDNNKHHCFVFDSEKCAEEITLTIGQAFDLAYRKFLDSSSKDMDTKKQFLLTQKKVQQLTEENLNLKARVADLERLIEPKLLDDFDKNKNNIIKSSSTPVQDDPVVGRRLENLILEEPEVPYTNGTSDSSAVYAKVQRTHPTAQPQSPVQGTPVLAPPPPVPSRSHHGAPITPTQKTQAEVDLFGSTPFSAQTPPRPAIPTIPAPSIPPRLLNPPPQKAGPVAAPRGAGDPFGMGSFDPSSAQFTPSSTQDLDQQILNVDRELMDLQTGFSRGISFDSDFSLADLDPLNQK